MEGNRYLVGRRKQLARGRRQHRKQLLEGQEGLAILKLHPEIRNVDHVGNHGRIVVWVEPGPGGNAAIVVLQHPVYALPQTEYSVSASASLKMFCLCSIAADVAWCISRTAV